MEDSFDAAILDGTSLAGASAWAGSDPNHGWQKVTYGKRQRRPQQRQAAAAADPDLQRHNGNVFASVEQKAHERRRVIESAAAAEAAAEVAPARSRRAPASSDGEGDDSGTEENKVHENAEATKKAKAKKLKKPKITVAEAAAKIDASDLAAFLIDVTASYESQQDIQLMRFADYFGRAFASVSASQFPWVKMFKESPLAKVADVPISDISEAVYKTSADWLAQKSPDSLGEFVLWCLDGILADMASQQAAAKNSKKIVQQTSVKAQVAIFVVLAMALRRKPDTLINILPKIKDNSKYQGQEKLPVLVWVIAQVSNGDIVIGMYLWAHYLFPVVCAKQGGNPQSRNLVLQLVERILSMPKARPILLNGAVRKGERLIPPVAFDLLMRMTFPASAARIKATERFEAIYPLLKEIALAGSPGTKTTKQVAQQLLPASVRAMHETTPELTKEATDIFIWCLVQNAECYKQWEKIHLESIGASTVVLKKLSDQWKEYSTKISPDTLKETLKHLKAKNEEALNNDLDASKQASIKEADKYCSAVSGKLMRGANCIKSSFSVFFLLMVACVAVFLSMESSEWNKLQAILKAYFPVMALE